MDKRATGVLLGMVAGDGYLNVRERKRTNGSTYTSSELVVLHSAKQRAYCEHKLGLCKELLGTNATLRERKHGPGNKYFGISFSVANPYFKMLKGWTYEEGTKKFNSVWLDHLTPEGVAIWYMDDGHARRNYNKDGRVTSVATDISTCCTEAETDLICQWFWDTHKIKFKKYRTKGNWSIQCNTENSRLFAHLVQPFIIDSMLYKLSHVADLNSHERRTSIAKCAATTCTGNIFDNRHGGLCARCYSKRYQLRVKQRLATGDDIVRTRRKLREVTDKELSQ